MQEPDDNPTCALRALTLCDGQVLEESDRGLTTCLCSTIQLIESIDGFDHAPEHRAIRQRLIERTMALSQRSLPPDR